MIKFVAQVTGDDSLGRTFFNQHNIGHRLNDVDVLLVNTHFNMNNESYWIFLRDFNQGHVTMLTILYLLLPSLATAMFSVKFSSFRSLQPLELIHSNNYDKCLCVIMEPSKLSPLFLLLMWMTPITTSTTSVTRNNERCE
ncbi:hypothetical protein V6N11_035898 [Hibiscus sabdariffa]|uniref:Uncharacterized protein n=1 Tax=Hibiscus sabdariffa TaxID=183260 RepID=A0ABR2R8S2_9ROSI